MRNFKIIICIITIAALFSGCMNTQHLKDLVIVEGMGIDNSDSQVQVSVQTLNVAINSTSEVLKGNNTIVTQSKGDTVLDAISNLSKVLSKKLFFGQNKLVVFSKDVTQKDFEKKLDYFLRSTDSRVDVAVCISDTKAKDILESKENDALVPCESILYLIKNSEKQGLGAYVTTNDLLNAYSDKTSDIYLPVLEKDEEEKSVKIKGIGIFSKNNLAYITDDDETMGFLLIKGAIDNAILEIEDKELGKIGIQLSDVSAKKSAAVENGGIVFNVKLKAQIMINEVEKGMITKLDEEKVKRISKLTEEEINSKCKKAFEACQKYKSDCVRAGEYLAKDEPEAYEAVSDEWEIYFSSVKINVDSSTELKKISDNTQVE
ncbi:MAG: Ger(x)C family spore germination protein [Eubacterium sp.]